MLHILFFLSQKLRKPRLLTVLPEDNMIVKHLNYAYKFSIMVKLMQWLNCVDQKQCNNCFRF